MTQADDHGRFAGPSAHALSPLEREAMDWIVHLKSGVATQEDAHAFTHWRGQSTEHETAFRHSLLMHKGLSALVQQQAEASVLPFGGRKGLDRRALFIGGGAVAASMGGVWLVNSPPMGLWPSWAELRADYRTGTGKRLSVAPAQGVNVELNTRTSIGDLRETSLSLINGEAYVSIDRAEPFTTTAGNGRVIARKAAFNLRFTDKAALITCLTGELTLRHASAEMHLSEGQQVPYDSRKAGTVTQARAADTAAWRDGLLVFRGEALSEVIANINRYQTGRIVLTDAKLGRYPVNAVFHLDRIDKAGSQIANLLDVKTTALPGGIVLIG